MLLILLLLAGVWVGFCCVDPSAMRQVKSPRDGRVITPLGGQENDNGVAVVYSKHYQMSMGGLEKLHSFDIHKYAKIYMKLNSSGLLKP